MTQEQTAAPRDGYKLLVLALLFLVYTFNFIDRQIMGILAPAIKADLDLTDAQLGELGGLAFALFYTTLGVPIAWLADRWNRTWIMTIALTVWSGFTALCGFANSFTQLFLARVGVGVGEAGGVAPAYSLISDYFPPKQRARALAAYSFGIPIGSAAGIAIGGAIASLIDWRVAFIAVGVAGVLLAPIFRLIVREPQRGAYDAPRSPVAETRMRFGLVEIAFLLVAVALFGLGYVFFVFRPAALDAPFGIAAVWTRWFYAGLLVIGGVIGTWLASRVIGVNKASFWLLSFGAACSSIMGYGIFFWMPSFLIRSYGFDLPQASVFYASILAIGGVAGVWLGGALADAMAAKRSRFALIPAAAFVLSLPCYVAGMLSPSPTIAFFLFLPPTALGLVWLGPVITAVQHLAPAHKRTTASALFLFVNNLIGLGLGTLLIGALSDALTDRFAAESLRFSILAGTGFYVLAAALFLMAATTLKRDWVD